MRILVIKALRDLYRSKLRTISIIAAIALSVSLGIGLVNATKDAFASFDKRLELTNYEDIDIMFDRANISLEDVESIEGVDSVMGRLFFHAQAEYEGKGYETDWVAAPYLDSKPYAEINGYQITDGSYVSGPDSREALVGNLFAKNNGVKPGDHVRLIFENETVNLTVSGIAASPEYIYVVSEEGWPEPSLLLPLFTTYETAAKILGIPEGTYNELLVRVKDGYSAENVKEEIENLLTDSGVRITRSLLGTQEMDYQFSRTDAGAMGQMGWVFGVIILVVTAVVIYNSLARLIASQRAYIGVMGALGGRMTDIVIHYTLFGLFLGIVGALIGIPFGIGISYGIMYAYGSVIGLVSPAYTIFWIYPLIFTMIGIIIATAGAFIGALNAVRIGPREALSSQYQEQDIRKKPIVERLFDRIAYRRPVLMRIPVRNLGRHRIRTLVTIVSLAVSMLLVFSCLSLTMAFTQPLEKNYDDYETWDLKVDLAAPDSMERVESVISSNGFQGTDAEPMIDDFYPVLTEKGMNFARVEAFEKDSSLRHYHVIEGREDLDNGILVGSILAKNLDLGVGDNVTFVIGNRTSTTTVSGITGELMDDSFLMTLGFADRLLFINDTVNGIIMNLDDMSKEEVESMVRGNFSVASFSYTDDVINGLVGMLQDIIAMFFIFIAFGVIAEVLFISTTVVLNILDREMEFVSLRAIGTNPIKIKAMIVSETLILLAGGLIIGLPLGVYTTKWAMAYIVEGLMYFVLQIPFDVYLYTSLIAIVAAAGSAYLSARYVTRMDLASVIRNRFVT
jgi:putative ABC transport system permease protein